jgi:hypothetical protein
MAIIRVSHESLILMQLTTYVVSTKQDSSEANSSTAICETPVHLWNQMLITAFKRAREWVLFIASLIHIVTSYVFDIHFSIILSHLSMSLKRFSFTVFHESINFSYL